MNQAFRRLLFHALIDTSPPWLRHQKQGCYQLRDGVAFTASDLPGPSFHKVAVFGPSPPLDRLLEMAAEFYGAKEGGYGIMVEADAGHPVEAEIKARGWRVEEDEPALVLPAIPASPPVPNGLVIHPATDERGLTDFRNAGMVGFGAPPEMARLFAPSLDFANDPAISLLVGYCDGKAVATGTCFVLGDVAWIAGVSTLPDMRSRGYGTALTWAALAEGARRGSTAGALNSGPMSFSLYRRMGFLHVCNHRSYAVPVAQEVTASKEP